MQDSADSGTVATQGLFQSACPWTLSSSSSRSDLSAPPPLPHHTRTPPNGVTGPAWSGCCAAWPLAICGKRRGRPAGLDLFFLEFIRIQLHGQTSPPGCDVSSRVVAIDRRRRKWMGSAGRHLRPLCRERRVQRRRRRARRARPPSPATWRSSCRSCWCRCRCRCTFGDYFN
eukprot:gene11598-biopygen9427